MPSAGHEAAGTGTRTAAQPGRSDTADAVVVGGGTIGAWCAYFLRQAGVGRVILVFRGDNPEDTAVKMEQVGKAIAGATG